MSIELISAVVAFLSLALAFAVYVAKTSYRLGQVDEKVNHLQEDVLDLYKKQDDNERKYVTNEVFIRVEAELKEIKLLIQSKL